MYHSDKSERSATTKKVSKLKFKIPKIVILVPKRRDYRESGFCFLDSPMHRGMTRFMELQKIKNFHFLPMVHPDASGKKQEIHNEDTKNTL